MATKAHHTRTKKQRRPAWTGFLRFGLVSIPVKAYPLKNNEAEVELHWLHEPCLNRIRQQKTCPVHGEVSNDEIISGYKMPDEEYIAIDPDELQKLRAQSEDTIDIKSVVGPHDIDDIYYTDKTYYLLPDGDAGLRPYCVFQEALKQDRLCGVAEAVLFRREHLLLVRALDSLLTVTFLNYPERIQSLSQVANQVGKVKNLSREVEMAKALIGQLVDEKFDIHQYHDRYAENLMKLVEAKAKGQRIEEPAELEPPVALDFMEALRRSVEKTAKTRGHRKSGPHDRRAS